MIFLPGGLVVARFVKPSMNCWFPLHIVLMTSGVVLAVAAFILAIMMTSTDFLQPNILSIVHSWLGLIVMSALIAEPILGLVADRMYDPQRAYIPFFPDRLHWYIGRYSVAVAVLNVLLGMLYLQVEFYWWILFGLWILVFVTIYHGLEYFRQRETRRNYLFQKEERSNGKETELPDINLSNAE